MKKMAQRAEKEETEFKVVPEALTHCVNNCGVTGNPSTNNMCQNCFTATASSAAATTSTSSQPSISSSSSPNLKFPGDKSPRSSLFSFAAEPAPETSRKTTATEIARSDESPSRRVVNRCSGCRRKVGLTGFRCRCGELFCSEHRYSDRHVCSYDYKAAGREAIARENPVVKAAKIVRV